MSSSASPCFVFSIEMGMGKMVLPLLFLALLALGVLPGSGTTPDLPVTERTPPVPTDQPFADDSTGSVRQVALEVVAVDLRAFNLCRSGVLHSYRAVRPGLGREFARTVLLVTRTETELGRGFEEEGLVLDRLRPFGLISALWSITQGAFSDLNFNANPNSTSIGKDYDDELTDRFNHSLHLRSGSQNAGLR